MVWSWSSDESPSPTRLVIELEARGQSTRLTLRHTGDAAERTVRATGEGWIDKLRLLTETLTETGSASPKISSP
jgi:Activator of Hsp90 ATPase homolog 1-like protein